MQNYIFTISGRAQGVFYRKTICQNAQAQNFNGYVKNLSNGDVEAALSCNSKEELDKFIEILQKGSSNSEVINITTSTTNKIFKNGFTIKHE